MTVPEEVQAPPAPSPSDAPPEGLSQVAAQPEATPPSDTATPPPSPDGGEPTGEKREDVDWDGLTTLLDTTKEAAREEGRSSMQSQLQPMLQRQTAHYQAVEKLAKDFSNSWQDMMDSENGVSKDDLNSIFRRNEEAIQAISGAHNTQGYTSGARGLMAEIAKRAGVDAGNTDTSLQYFLQGSGDATFIDDFLKGATKAAVTKALAEAETRWTKLADERSKHEESARVKQGETKPADVTGTSGGAGRTDAELKSDPTTPVSKLMEIRQRERAAGG